MADEEGIPFPPIDEPVPVPPITPEPPSVTTPVEKKLTPTPPTQPAPPVAPEIPDVGSGGGGFPDILDLAALLLVLGILALLAYITNLTNFVLKLVWSTFGRRGSAPQLSQTQLGQPVSNLLAPYVQSRDAQLGSEFTQAGGIVARVGRAILAAEDAIGAAVDHFLPIENKVTTHAQQAAHVSNRVSHLEATGAVQHAQATFGQAQALQRAQGLDQRLTALETHITTLIDPELDQLKAQIPPLQKGATIAWDEIKKHNEALGAAGLALGVAGALAQLGGSWIRCESTQAIGEALCKSNDNLIKDLLSGLIDIAALLDLCALVTLLYDVAESGPVQGILKELTGGIEALLQCRGLAAYDPPTVPAAPLPPALIGYPALAPVM